MSDDNNMATSSLLPPTPPIVDDAMTNPPKAREPVQDALFEESNSSNGGEHHSANTPERTAATPEVCRSLFIENLHPECEFTHLYHYFSRFGEVSSVRILRDAKKGVSRGIGYVNFSHCEDAHEARAKTDGATAIPLVCRDDAQPLHIRYADQEQAARHDDSKLFTLHYLPAFVTRAELLNVLAPFGDVVECNILSRSATRGPVKGSAIEPDAPNMEFNVASIEFSTSIAATRAACRLHRSCPFGPHPLHVKPDVKHTAPPRPTPGPHAAAPASSHRPPLPSYSKSANLQQPAALLQPTPQQRAAMVTAAMAPNSALQHHSGHYLYPHMQLQIPAAVQPFAGGFHPLGPQGAPMFQTMTPQFVYMTENGPVLHTAAAPHPGWPHVTTLPTAAYGMPPPSMTPMQAPSFVSLQTTPTHPFHMMAPSYPVFQYAVPPVPQAHAELFVDSNAAFSAPAAHQAP